MNVNHEKFMELAFREAEFGFKKKEVPIGAIVVYQNKIIGKGYNQTEILKDATAHAEMIAITSAFQFLNSSRLEDCILYTTLEPCPMCSGAIVLSKISLLVFGAYDKKMGSVSSLYNITNDMRLNHRLPCIGGVMEKESISILQEFFKGKRHV